MRLSLNINQSQGVTMSEIILHNEVYIRSDTKIPVAWPTVIYNEEDIYNNYIMLLVDALTLFDDIDEFVLTRG